MRTIKWISLACLLLGVAILRFVSTVGSTENWSPVCLPFPGAGFTVSYPFHISSGGRFEAEVISPAKTTGLPLESPPIPCDLTCLITNDNGFRVEQEIKNLGPGIRADSCGLNFFRAGSIEIPKRGDYFLKISSKMNIEQFNNAGAMISITRIENPVDWVISNWILDKMSYALIVIALLLMLRNRQLNEEIRLRKAKETELKESNTKLTHAMENLKEAHTELTKSGENLREANVQLTKSEENLKQVNIELTESEKTLREKNIKLTEAYKKLENAEIQMVRTERMRALGIMASGIAHDFNNALMPIMGLAEMLRDDKEILKNKEETFKALAELFEAAKDARSIVGRLRQFYKPTDQFPRELTNVNKLIDDVIYLTRPKWEAEKQAQGIRINVETQLAPDLPEMLFSQFQLREALINLVFNALDAMTQDGRLTFRTSAHGEWLIIEVDDTGTGMNEEVCKRCFEPFFTTKPAGKGTGLGLAMVADYVKWSKGRVEVRSVPGRGTTVILHLPIITHVTAEASALNNDINNEHNGPLRLLLLVVDDDERSYGMLERMLKRDNHEVEVAKSGPEAIEKLKKYRYDVVITDLAMRDVNGNQVARVSKKISKETPVILLTGFGDDVYECPAEVNKILCKPVGVDDLRKAIAEVTAPKKKNSTHKITVE